MTQQQTPKQARSLDELSGAIQDTITKVKAIPHFDYGDFSSEALKGDLIPLLEEAQVRTRNIDSLFDNIDAVRGDVPFAVDFRLRRLLV